MRYFFALLLSLLCAVAVPSDLPRLADFDDRPILVALDLWRAPRFAAEPSPDLAIPLPDVRRPDVRLVCLEQANARRERLGEHIRGAA